MIAAVALKWLRWRYGGDVHALRPPLGYHRRYCPRHWWYIALYWMKRAWWKIETIAFKKIWTTNARCMERILTMNLKLVSCRSQIVGYTKSEDIDFIQDVDTDKADQMAREIWILRSLDDDLWAIKVDGKLKFLRADPRIMI